MLDPGPVIGGEPVGDQRPVAGLGVALDAEQRRDRVVREAGGELVQIGGVEDLGDVAARVLGRELDPGALADPAAVVLGVLELAQLGRRRELLVVAVVDSRLGEQRLEPLRVRPGVLAAADPASLADVDDQADARAAQRLA